MKLKSLYSATLVLLICSLTWLSCKKDIKNENSNNPPATVNPIPAATPVTGSVSGLVVDETNTPVSGAEIKIGTNTFTTGANGIFTFSNVTLDKYISTVIINKTGYFKAFRSFSANATRNYISVKLIPKTLAGSVSSTNPTPVSLSNGTRITFQQNSIVDKATGAAYSGNVNVYASYIDPTSEDISSVVPGSFMGKDANNIYALSSTGMIAVDLESPGGQALQLANNQPATIQLPIPASLLSKAPATIDTWSLDDQGVWKKEGTATKNGNAYDMQVTHFSFWNCDVPANSTYLSIHVQDQNGNSLSNTLVSLTVPDNNTWWATTYGYTDSLGNVSGIIPAGVELEMNVYANPYTCTGPLFSQNVGPFTSNSAITVTVTTNAQQILTVSGTATDCSGALQDGTAIISAGQYGYYYTSVVNGSYSIDIAHCGTLTELSVNVFDYNTGSQSSSGIIAVSGNSVTVPVINVCGGTQTAVFTMGTSQGNCQMGTYIGLYTAGTAVTNNAVTVMVDVQQPGTYVITTPVVNGISFSGSGTFTTLGQQFVVLTATGTPVNAGTYTFQTEYMGMTGCYFFISVSGQQIPQAVIDLGTGTCGNMQINGTYTAGMPLLQTANTVMVTINVTSPGTYNIFTNTANGMQFSDSGTVTATGPVNILLFGTGIPTAPGSNVFTLQTAGGTQGCSFTIQTQPNSGASFIFGGAPGGCSGASAFGTYSVGVPLTGQNTVPIVVEVITPGAYNITTNAANGMSFSATGVFPTTGMQTIILTGNGTPTSMGLFTFVTQSGTTAGCSFTVLVN